MTAVLGKIQCAARLSATDWLYFFQAWGWLLVFDIGLQTRPFPGLQAFAARLTPRPSSSPAQTEDLICNLTLAVDRARYNHIRPMTCCRR